MNTHTNRKDFNFTYIHPVIDQQKLDNDVSEEKVSLIDIGTLDTGCSSVGYSTGILTTQGVIPQSRCVSGRIGIG